MSDEPKPFCPIMTRPQVVSRGLGVSGLKLTVLPIGETTVAPVQDLMSAGKRPASLGGLDLSSVGKVVTVYEVRGDVSAGAFLKTPGGTNPQDPDPELVADMLIVACQEARCRFWCTEQNDCRLALGGSAAALLLSSARQQVSDTNTADSGQGGDS